MSYSGLAAAPCRTPTSTRSDRLNGAAVLPLQQLSRWYLMKHEHAGQGGPLRTQQCRAKLLNPDGKLLLDCQEHYRTQNNLRTPAPLHDIPRLPVAVPKQRAQLAMAWQLRCLRIRHSCNSQNRVLSTPNRHGRVCRIYR